MPEIFDLPDEAPRPETLEDALAQLAACRRHARRLEERLLDARRAEAFGAMAGGIVHEFNNVLGILQGYAELARKRAPEGHGLARYIEEILHGVHRAQSLVAQVRTFSGRTDGGRQAIEAALMVKETAKLLRATVPSNVEIEVTALPGSGRVVADLVQLHRAFLGLCSQMAQAMAAEGGTLCVLVEERDVSGDEAAALGLAPGRYLCVTVQENVRESEPDEVDHIFDSHFVPAAPTPGAPEDTGLEFARDVVARHAGALVSSGEAGQDARAEVYLPLAPAEEAATDLAGDLPGGTEHVLFVDDEPGLREAGAQMLADLGYRVTTASSGREALDIFQANPERFAAVVTDRTMPVMPGERLARNLARLRPGLPVIMCTGHSGLLDEDSASRLGLAAFLDKPLSMRGLAETLRRVLDRAPA